MFYNVNLDDICDCDRMAEMLDASIEYSEQRAQQKALERELWLEDQAALAAEFGY